MAFSGAPVAQPDHAARAVRAALGMQAAMKRFNAERGGCYPMDMRIGVNSGLAIVGDIGARERRDYTVIGDTVNTASRLESSVCEPGQVVIGPRSRELVGNAFRLEALEPRTLKGKQVPLQPYRVIQPDAGAGSS